MMTPEESKAFAKRMTEIADQLMIARNDAFKEVRAALVEALQRAGEEERAARAAYSAPYSSADALTRFHASRGIQQGIGMAIDTLDRLAQA